ncbi:MAG: DUF2891 domain-containing protein [Gammaproteobacteria bacterium]|nr:DUF2891 domain-containing protein [Gammaproteobacteria bacterium]MBT8049630.1 DUF2891 domain-containing protein [Gammaproteobacteria bacterium]
MSKTLIALLMGLGLANSSFASEANLEARFARLALDCVHREYPNKIAHVMSGPEDAATPSQLHPVFYGCFDWHSSVHGHWLLVRLLRTAGDTLPTELADEIVTALDRSFTDDGVAGEVAYFKKEGRKAFERPYGAAWLLQLTAELREWDDPRAERWQQTLLPLETAVVDQIKAWLPNLAYPIRLGTHNQSMFAFGLILDWAGAAQDAAMTQMVTRKALEFHLADRGCPMDYEPSGEDFLSPCLMEADLMRRVLGKADFATWLDGFLPDIPRDGRADWLTPGIVIDPTDGKLVHLDGVNLSRAWALENIAATLPAEDNRRAALEAAARVHRDAGIANVSAEHYEGSHWLASFATYLVTKRGLGN